MAKTSNKTANVFARVEPEVKEQAEIILEQLGVPMSNAVSMFLKQVIIHRGIPFEVKLAARKPISMAELTEDEFNTEIARGMDDIENGRTHSAEKVAEEMHRLYGI